MINRGGTQFVRKNFKLFIYINNTNNNILYFSSNASVSRRKTKSVQR